MTTARVLVNADVRTMSAGTRRCDALAWSGDRITAVGPRDDVLRAAGEGAEVFDLGGATVLPGFIDAHHHACLSVLYGALVRLKPPAVTDIASLQSTLSAAAAKLERGRWLVALDWDEHLLSEHRAPTRDELDAAVPDHPVMALNYTCHCAVANSRALALAGIDRSTPDPAGGRIGRGRGGHPDGMLIERGMSRVERLARASLVADDAEGFFTRLREHHRALSAVGITRVCDTAVPGDLAELYREAQRRGALRVPTVMLAVETSGYLDAPRDALKGTPTGHVDGLLETGPVKLIFDGAPVCSMCLTIGQTLGAAVSAWGLALRRRSLDPLRAALSVQPRLGADGRLHSGIAIYSREEADRVVRSVVEHGFAVATHAIGNEAIDVALGAYAAAGSSLGRAGLPRIEHGAYPSREQVRRIAGLGAAVVSQPAFVAMPAFDSAPSIPGLPFLPHRWLLDAGVTLAGSSDYPVFDFDPLEGVRRAVTRRTASGRVFEPDQRVTLDEALAMYTRSAAEVSGCGDRCGTLEVGKRADVVVLAGPLHREEQLDAARVRATVIGGETAYGALGES